jgi:hypothetical protein
MKISAYFEDISFEISKVIRSARSSIIICVAWINFDIYRSVLEGAVARGVRVEILLADNTFNKTVPPSGVHTYRLRMADKLAIMHNKFCVVDGCVVVTGSYNWSRRAYRHFENIVVVEGAFDLALSFMHEFEELKKYFFDYSRLQKRSCDVNVSSNKAKTCSMDSFLVGILGPEEGLYDSSDVTLWHICAGGHVSLAAQQNYQFLSSILGLKDDPNADDELECGKDVERRLEHERHIAEGVRSFLDGCGFGEIRAVGRIVVINWNEHVKWGVPLEHEISFFWRDPLYRKVIPESFPQDAEYEKIYDRYLA